MRARHPDGASLAKSSGAVVATGVEGGAAVAVGEDTGEGANVSRSGSGFLFFIGVGGSGWGREAPQPTRIVSGEEKGEGEGTEIKEEEER